MSTVNATSSPAPATGTPSAPAIRTADPLASESTFLKLLVAQLKHQDPLSPADGLQFVTQLAQFTSLEQTQQMREDLDAILAQLKASAAASPGTTGPVSNS